MSAAATFALTNPVRGTVAGNSGLLQTQKCPSISETAKNKAGAAFLSTAPAQRLSQKCPGLESNQHALASATPSRWCVYQFRPPGKRGNQTSNTASSVW